MQKKNVIKDENMEWLLMRKWWEKNVENLLMETIMIQLPNKPQIAMEKTQITKEKKCVKF